MPGAVKVFGRVLVLGVIAASNMPADQAQAQMNPAIADLQAIFAALSTGRNVPDLIDMLAR